VAWTVEVSDEFAETGDANWYKFNLKKADEIYDAHLREIKE
jgi:hypothetical protein